MEEMCVYLLILCSTFIVAVANTTSCTDSGVSDCKTKEAKCVVDFDHKSNYTCMCPAGYEFNKYDVCEIIDNCTFDSVGYRDCSSEDAVCKNDHTAKKGYVCICAKDGQLKPEGKSCKDLFPDWTSGSSSLTSVDSHHSVDSSTSAIVVNPSSVTNLKQVTPDNGSVSSDLYPESKTDLRTAKTISTLPNLTNSTIPQIFDQSKHTSTLSFQSTQSSVTNSFNSVPYPSLTSATNNISDGITPLTINARGNDLLSSDNSNIWIVVIVICAVSLTISLGLNVYLIRRNRYLSYMQNNDQHVEKGCIPLGESVRKSNGMIILSYVFPNFHSCK